MISAVPGVRAALCVDARTAEGARKWNDANVLAISMRLSTDAVAREIVEAWVSSTYAGTEGESLGCIADLDAEDGSFHGPGIDVHHGFERGVLRTALVAAGFLDVRIDDCFVVEKGSRRYPVFLAICRKP